ncbi:hypothetical protein DPMN_180589 [Dreissena polymorpha]|uniref:Uncharacterized protein n=1 Tax=Dreissena polymorpha TaxID=45954 RepID=A0A9D4EGG1_DREPO|nr:hypothetical protein DPMN_180589 [Dreissena polymorpha]
MDGRVAEDIFPDWNSILHGNIGSTFPEFFRTRQTHSVPPHQRAWENITPESLTTAANPRTTTVVITPSNNIPHNLYQTEEHNCCHHSQYHEFRTRIKTLQSASPHPSKAHASISKNSTEHPALCVQHPTFLAYFEY